MVAYPSCKKEESASAAGARLLRNVKVESYLNEKMEERSKRTEITQDNVLKEIAAVAFAKASDYAKVIERQAFYEGIPLVNEETNEPILIQAVELTLTDRLNELQQKAIAGIKQGKNGVEVSLCDKMKALELLGRHIGMFKDKFELTNIQEEMNKLDDILGQMRGGTVDE